MVLEYKYSKYANGSKEALIVVILFLIFFTYLMVVGVKETLGDDYFKLILMPFNLVTILFIIWIMRLVDWLLWKSAGGYKI